MVDVERWLSYEGTCHVILLAKLHDMYLYKTDTFFHINHYLQSVSKVALLHRFYCTQKLVGAKRAGYIIAAEDIFKYFSYFSQKKALKYKSLAVGKNTKNIINAEFAQKVVKIKGLHETHLCHIYMLPA